MHEAITQLHSAGTNVDLVELRIDGIRNVKLEQLLQQPRPKVIITNRRASEGGQFTGTAKNQLEILTTALQSGAEYVDIEMSWGTDIVRELLSLRKKSKVIVSYHNFTETPKQLEAIYRHLKKVNGQIIKIAVMANTITDCKRMFQVIEQAREDRQQIIGLCMGEQGEISRILGGLYGNFLTFASLNSKQQTASGQRPVDDMVNMFRADTLNNRTKIFGLIGNPVAQSEGIHFHNIIFTRKKCNAVYVNFLTTDLKRFITTFANDISGASVTMPFKEQIVPLLDILQGEAAELRAVNTVIRHRGKLTGHNTDLPAITGLIKQHRLKNKNVVVLGTGGTSKTMAFASLLLRANTTIVGRSPEKAQSLARELNCGWAAMEELPHISCDLLMNGTSVGMPGKHSGKQLVPKNYFHKDLVVFDAVNSNHLTPLLTSAKAKGCHIIDGNELFMRQARLQSKLFLAAIS